METCGWKMCLGDEVGTCIGSNAAILCPPLDHTSLGLSSSPSRSCLGPVLLSGIGLAAVAIWEMNKDHSRNWARPRTLVRLFFP